MQALLPSERRLVDGWVDKQTSSGEERRITFPAYLLILSSIYLPMTLTTCDGALIYDLMWCYADLSGVTHTKCNAEDDVQCTISGSEHQVAQNPGETEKSRQREACHELLFNVALFVLEKSNRMETLRLWQEYQVLNRLLKFKDDFNKWKDLCKRFCGIWPLFYSSFTPMQVHKTIVCLCHCTMFVSVQEGYNRLINSHSLLTIVLSITT